MRVCSRKEMDGWLGRCWLGSCAAAQSLEECAGTEAQPVRARHVEGKGACLSTVMGFLRRFCGTEMQLTATLAVAVRQLRLPKPALPGLNIQQLSYRTCSARVKHPIGAADSTASCHPSRLVPLGRIGSCKGYRIVFLPCVARVPRPRQNMRGVENLLLDRPVLVDLEKVTLSPALNPRLPGECVLRHADSASTSLCATPPFVFSTGP